MTLRASLPTMLIALTLLAGTSLSAQSRPSTKISAVAYIDSVYGLRVMLPASWQGYTVVTENGIGTEDGSPASQADTFITVRLCHPRWTADEPREDIPIMIFTLSQWSRIQKETLIVSAAPFPPSEQARNAHYVFALPPRYDFDDLPGLDEVHKIIAAMSIHAVPPAAPPAAKQAQ